MIVVNCNCNSSVIIEWFCQLSHSSVNVIGIEDVGIVGHRRGTHVLGQHDDLSDGSSDCKDGNPDGVYDGTSDGGTLDALLLGLLDGR